MSNIDWTLFYGMVISPWFLIPLGLLLFVVFKGYRLFGVVVVKNDKVGIITKKFAVKRLANGKIIATDGEAGIQANTLTPGIHFMYWPWQYSIEFGDLISIPADSVGVVTTIDGEPIPPGHLLGKHVDSNNYQDATAFLKNTGQRGPQADILPPGVFRLNTKVFEVELKPRLTVPPNQVAIITTTDGIPLDPGEIAGPLVSGHSSYQDAFGFIQNKGKRGLQTQPLLSGIYYTNPRFTSPEMVDLTSIEIGNVGVVISFVGEQGKDQSGSGFTHGNIVEKGQRGVWDTPLDPGRYPINTRVMKVVPVPTTNIVLNWITNKKESHNLDATLTSIDVRSMDGFSFPLEVSQIIHIAAANAPKVIARFGTVLSLVTQVLEPIINNWFRNAAQDRKFVDFLTARQEIQEEATKYIKEALDKYDVEAVETLIGDIDPPAKLMETRQAQEIAEQEKAMFDSQQRAQTQRQMMEQAKAEAETRGQVVQASRSVEVAKLNAEAVAAKATGEANAKTVNATADAQVLRVTGEAAAAKTLAIGNAEAEVLEKKVTAIGQEKWAAMEVLRNLAENKTAIVPQIITSGGNSGGSGVAEAMMGMLLSGMANKENGHIKSE